MMLHHGNHILCPRALWIWFPTPPSPHLGTLRLNEAFSGSICLRVKSSEPYTGPLVLHPMQSLPTLCQARARCWWDRGQQEKTLSVLRVGRVGFLSSVGGHHKRVRVLSVPEGTAQELHIHYLKHLQRPLYPTNPSYGTKKPRYEPNGIKMMVSSIYNNTQCKRF